MSNVGRNDPCPCGSGKKFKRCCLDRLEAEERIQRLHAERERLVAERESLAEALADAKAALHESQLFERVDRLSESVILHIKKGQLDEAEATARQLLSEFPDEPLGTERLGEVYEARGKRQEAAEEYRRGVALMDELGEGHYCDCCRARMVKMIRGLDPDHPAPALLRDPQ